MKNWMSYLVNYTVLTLYSATKLKCATTQTWSKLWIFRDNTLLLHYTEQQNLCVLARERTHKKCICREPTLLLHYTEQQNCRVLPRVQAQIWNKVCIYSETLHCGCIIQSNKTVVYYQGYRHKCEMNYEYTEETYLQCMSSRDKAEYAPPAHKLSININL